MTTLPKARPSTRSANCELISGWQRQSKPQPHFDGLWRACQALIHAWENLGDLVPVPQSLIAPLIALERALLQYKEVEESKRFYSTGDAEHLLGVDAKTLKNRAASGRLVLGVHYLLWNEPGFQPHYTWNVWAINQAMSVALSNRKPLPTQAVAGGGHDN